jgi:hypothetical protein
MIWGILEGWLVVVVGGWCSHPCFGCSGDEKLKVLTGGGGNVLPMGLLSFLYTELEGHQHTFRKLKSTATLIK